MRIKNNWKKSEKEKMSPSLAGGGGCCCRHCCWDDDLSVKNVSFVTLKRKKVIMLLWWRKPTGKTVNLIKAADLIRDKRSHSYFCRHHSIYVTSVVRYLVTKQS